MVQSRGWRVLAGIIAVGLTGAAAHAAEPTTQPSPQELIDKVNQLQSEVNQLKAQTQQNQTDVTEAIKQVVADSEKHSQLLDSEGGFVSGWSNNRFIIQSPDGNYTLRPWIHVQFRYSTSDRREATGVQDDVESGFELRRARLGFDGNLFSPDFTYFVNWATFRENGSLNVTDKTTGKVTGTSPSPVGGLPVLEEAWVKDHIPDTDFYVKAGQMHDPLDHEAIVGSKYRAPEASLTGDIFANTDTFTQAVTFIYDPKDFFRFEGGFTDGIRAANTNYEDPPNNGILYRWGAAARGEVKIMGDWKDYDQLTSLNDKKDLLVVGLGGDYSEGMGFGTLSVTPDIQYATTSGWFFYGSYFARYTRHNPGIASGALVSTSFGTPGTPNQDTYEYSGLAQAAYLIDEHWEPYVRYEYLSLAGTPAGSNNHIQEISGGMNYYFHGHNAKFTGQAMYLPQGIPVNDDSSDVLISNNKPEVVFIAQFQLLL